MEFSAQIKKIRTDNQLTQEQLAQQLNVSRQTISSWENNRNIPDLEMVVSIAKLFNISLDQLILGDDIMREKLVKDSSEVKKAKINMVSVILFLLGVLSLTAKSIIGAKVGKDGVLHDPFVLLPLGYLLVAVGIIIFVVTLIKNRKK